MVYSINSGWAKIDYKGTKAYVSAKYIEKKQLQDSPVKKTRIIANEDKASSKSVDLEHGNTKRLELVFTSSISLGLSNFFSFDAYSNPRFGFGIDAGVRLRPYFLPNKMFSEASAGFMMLGNSNYSFPSILINVLPIGYKFHLPINGLNKYESFVVGGLSLQLIGGRISFSTGENYYVFHSKTTLNLILKGGTELTNHLAVGVLYMHGLTNVCTNLPIGLKHSAFQIYGTWLFNH